MNTDRLALYAPLVLRVGLGVVMLWFGYQQLMQPDNWVGWVPEWVSILSLAPETVVFLNGMFEIISGALLVLGILVRVVSVLLFLHLVLIIIEIGLTAIGMRDVAIAVGFASLAMLAMLGAGPHALYELPRARRASASSISFE